MFAMFFLRAESKSTDLATVKTVNSQMTLGDLIRTDTCMEAISQEMVDLMTRTDERVNAEADILAIMNQSIQLFDPTLKVIPFGSSAYGFSGSKTNYDLLIDTRK